MVKVEVIEEFTLKKFEELKNIERVNKKEDGRLFVGDTFKCNNDMTDYLTGNNPINRAVVKVVEVFPEQITSTGEKQEELSEESIQAPVEEKKTIKRKSTKKTTKKQED